MVRRVFSRLPTILILLAPVCLAGQSRIQAVGEQPGTRAPRPGPVTGPRDRPPSEEASTGTARISGRVIGGEAGRPLRKAVVFLFGESIKEGRTTTTDEQGRYELKEIPAGRFHLTASKGSYVAMSYGQSRPFQPGRPIELADGQRMENVNFNLPRGSVIAGRITDEFGEPVASVGVQVLRYVYVEGRRQLVPAGGFMNGTDDLGRYRVFGLPPGEYYVSASANQMRGMMMSAQSDTRSGFAQTYFPGTPALGEAERIRLGVGEENASVSFALMPARTAQVSGTVLDSQGSPLKGGFIGVTEDTKGSMSFMMFGGGMVRSDGTFAVSNLPPGSYILHVNSERGDAEGESAAVPVSVASDDIAGLTIVTTPPALVTGQLLFETPPAETVEPADFTFYATAVQPISMMRGSGVSVKDDWTFEARFREGPGLVRSARVPDGWVLKAVTHAGVDVTDSGIPFRPGERVDGVQLVLSSRIAVVNGTVSDERGQPARDYTVVVFADDPNRWGPASRYVFAARPTQEGAFEVSKLPAGHYLAVALEYLEEGQHTDPEYLSHIRGHATPFELTDGERRTLNLKLVRGT